MIISCSKKNNDSKESPQGESKYKRIVVMDPAVVEMIYLLGAEDKIVGITKLQRSKIWPEDKTDKLESVGTFTNVSVEKVLSLKPDLVIASTFYAPEGFGNLMKSNNYYAEKDKYLLRMIDFLDENSTEAYFIDMNSKRLNNSLFEIVVKDVEFAIFHSMNIEILQKLKEKNIFVNEIRISKIDDYVNTNI